MSTDGRTEKEERKRAKTDREKERRKSKEGLNTRFSCTFDFGGNAEEKSLNLENEREFWRVLGEINGREAVMRKRKIRKCGLERERKEQSSDILTSPASNGLNV